MSSRPGVASCAVIALRPERYLLWQMVWATLCGPEPCGRQDKPHAGSALFGQCFQTRHNCHADRSTEREPCGRQTPAPHLLWRGELPRDAAGTLFGDRRQRHTRGWAPRNVGNRQQLRVSCCVVPTDTHTRRSLPGFQRGRPPSAGSEKRAALPRQRRSLFPSPWLASWAGALRGFPFPCGWAYWARSARVSRCAVLCGRMWPAGGGGGDQCLWAWSKLHVRPRECRARVSPAPGRGPRARACSGVAELLGQWSSCVGNSRRVRADSGSRVWPPRL